MIALLWGVDHGGQLQPAFPGADVGDVPDELASGAGAVKSRSTWSAAVFDPALPGRSMIAGGSPVPSGPWSMKERNGCNP